MIKKESCTPYRALVWPQTRTTGRRIRAVYFCDDSSNDKPVFAYFSLSIGVHNLLKFEKRLS